MMGRMMLSHVSLSKEVTSNGYSNVFQIVVRIPCSVSCREIRPVQIQSANLHALDLNLSNCGPIVLSGDKNAPKVSLAESGAALIIVAVMLS